MPRQDDSAPYAQLAGFHPEFGYLCPSSGLRRRVRQAFKLGIAAIAVIAGAALGLSSVLTTSPKSQVVREPVAAQPAQNLENLAEHAPPSVPSVVPAEAPAPAPSALPTVAPSGPAELAHAQALCADLSESFLAPQCRTAKKSRAARAAEAASRRAAAVTTAPEAAPGKAASEKAAPERALPQKVAREKAPSDAAAPEKAASSVKAAPVDAAKGDVAKASGVSPDDPAAAPDKPKKPVRTARKRAPSDDAALAAAAPQPAPAPQPAFGLFGFFHDLARIADGPSTASWQ